MGRPRDPQGRAGVARLRTTADATRFAGHILSRIGRTATPDLAIRDRILRGAPAAAAILAPDSADAIAEVLALCSAEAWPARITGAATAPFHDPRHVIAISCHRLDAVTEHEPADLVVGSGCGIRLNELAGTLAAHRQWLPLDPPDAGAATLGGTIAAGAAGPLRAGHGSPRDMALGLEVVTGDGRRLRFGGRVVKNVAGYDAVRVLVGSHGRLGALTHAFMRLRAVPTHDATLTFRCGGGADAAAGACARALRIRDAVEPAALEVVSFPAPAEAREWLVAVRVQGGEAGVAADIDAVRRLEPSATTPTDGAAWWRGLSEAEALGAGAEHALLMPDGLAEALREVARRLERLGDPRTVAVHVTDGRIRTWLPPEALAAESALTGIAPAHAADPRVEDLTRRLCAVFDPAGILQPPEQADG